MLDVDQNYGEPETPKPLPTFKDCVAQDVQTVFFNLNEFAEERYIDDKGLMPCITQHPGVTERAAHWEGGAKQSFDQGMYKAALCEAERLWPYAAERQTHYAGQETELQNQVLLPESRCIPHGT